MKEAYSAIFGWFAFSFGHYWIHRYWHANFHKSSRMIEGEKLHHLFYDDVNDSKKDMHRLVVTPPASLIILALFFMSLVLGPVFLGSAIICVVIDDLAHRSVHDHTIGFKSHPPKWFEKIHNTHHKYRDCNFAFVTGHIWDRLFGTYRAV